MEMLMPYDLNWFAKNGNKLAQEFERLRLEEFHRHMDEFFAKQKANQTSQ
jgi:hypothetical protein